MTAHQVEFTLCGQPMARGDLEDLAEALYDALVEHAKLIALGPVVTVGPEAGSIDVLFTAYAKSGQELHTKAAHAAGVLEAEAESFGIRRSTTKELSGSSREVLAA